MRWLLVGGLVFAPASALSQNMDMPGMAGPAPACTAMDKDLPAELSGWTAAKVPLTAALSSAGVSAADIALGQPYDLGLSEVSKVSFSASPGKPAARGAFCGLVGLSVRTPGTYVVALGAGAWVDVLKDGAPLTPSDHGHGPACSTLRKRVAFDLSPGAYLLQLSSAPSGRIALMVQRKP
jgi:hypothetical protein